MAAVRRRRVFHLAGYDPRGVAFYRALYADELAKQSRINGLQARIEPADEPESFRVITAETVTDYTFLPWEDVVRAHWRASAPVKFLRALTGFLALARRGALGLAWRTHGRLFATLVYPFALTLVCFLAAAVPLVILALVQRRLHLFWLICIFHFIAERGAGRIPALDARADAFAKRITEDALAKEADEVLIVGHSVGADLAVSTVARLLGQGKPVSLLTMGHLIPLTAMAPQAGQLRDELTAVARAREAAWVDVTATQDWLCLKGLDPVAGSGAAAGHQPRRVQARFHSMFRPETLRRARWQFVRMHLQYLMAFERPGAFDFFLITAGPMRLAERFPPGLPSR